MMNDKIALLNDLGNPEDLKESTQKWPNYLELDFTKADIPDLIAIITDEELYESPNGEYGMWLHLHVWRTLGQLKAVDAIDPIISTFDFFNLVEDKFALEELPEVIAMIGEQAIEPLAAHLLSISSSTYVRSIVNDALGGIAKQQPEYRDKVLAKYKAYLQAPDPLSTRLNGYIVALLIELKAMTLIDDIRQLYNKEYVDLSITGNLEKVEAKLLGA